MGLLSILNVQTKIPEPADPPLASVPSQTTEWWSACWVSFIPDFSKSRLLCESPDWKWSYPDKNWIFTNFFRAP